MHEAKNEKGITLRKKKRKYRDCGIPLRLCSSIALNISVITTAPFIYTESNQKCRLIYLDSLTRVHPFITIF